MSLPQNIRNIAKSSPCHAKIRMIFSEWGKFRNKMLAYQYFGATKSTKIPQPQKLFYIKICCTNLMIHQKNVTKGEKQVSVNHYLTY